MRPSNIQLIGNTLSIVWDDGSESYFNSEFLRKHSPSAQNIGERDIFGNQYGGDGPKEFPGVTIVDWEYSGMNDPLWDLGDLSVEAGFGPAEDREMLEAWCGGPPTPAQAGRMILHKAMCDLLWTLWGLIQHGNGNPAEDFWAYATGRFDRCRALMATPDFADALKAVRAG